MEQRPLHNGSKGRARDRSLATGLQQRPQLSYLFPLKLLSRSRLVSRNSLYLAPVAPHFRLSHSCNPRHPPPGSGSPPSHLALRTPDSAIMTFFSKSAITFVSVNILRVLSIVAICLVLSGEIVVMVSCVPLSLYSTRTRLLTSRQLYLYRFQRHQGIRQQQERRDGRRGSQLVGLHRALSF